MENLSGVTLSTSLASDSTARSPFDHGYLRLLADTIKLLDRASYGSMLRLWGNQTHLRAFLAALREAVLSDEPSVELDLSKVL